MKIIQPFKNLFVHCLVLCIFLFSANVFSEAPQKSTQQTPINLFEEKQKLEELALENQIIEQNGVSGELPEGEENIEPEDSYESVYKVELLVFAYVNTGEENSEIWRNPVRPTFEEFQSDLSDDLSTNETQQTLDETTNNFSENTLTKKNTYVFLNPEEKDLSEFTSIIRKMKINGHYRTLQHKIWQQKVLEESANDFFYLEGGNKYLSFEQAKQVENQQNDLAFTEFNEKQTTDETSSLQQGQSELVGTVHIFRSRYLHIRTDLWFSEFVENDAGICLESDSLNSTEEIEHPQSQPNHSHVPSYTALTNFHLKERRRMRGGELHYLDHPRFGLLIKFTRIEKPETSTAQ